MRHRWVALLTLAAAGVLAAAPALHEGQPAVQPAKPGTQCVADPAFMRRNHMQLLKHQRDDTVRAGIRGADARYSLRQCIECHASPASHSVAADKGDFCVSCHQYAAVRVDCFECHSGRATVLGAAR